MEKEQFNNLLTNFTSLTEEEAQQLTLLSAQFPYSQVIHNLAARAAQDSNLASKDSLLHKSAVYSTDRHTLKEVMIAPRKQRVEPEVFIETAQPVITPQEIAHDEEIKNLHESVAKDLADLQESRRLYELTIERLENEKMLPLPDKAVKAPEPEPEPANDSLIEEIKSTKKKIKPENDKQKEQIEIIDQFIKTQPGISRPNSKPIVKNEDDSDLSEPSAQFSENIVSETLVELLLKQGKKERAIEALKKLIWKFPQKKAYFAAQIEDLRK